MPPSVSLYARSPLRSSSCAFLGSAGLTPIRDTPEIAGDRNQKPLLSPNGFPTQFQPSKLVKSLVDADFLALWELNRSKKPVGKKKRSTPPSRWPATATCCIEECPIRKKTGEVTQTLDRCNWRHAFQWQGNWFLTGKAKGECHLITGHVSGSSEDNFVCHACFQAQTEWEKHHRMTRHRTTAERESALLLDCSISRLRHGTQTALAESQRQLAALQQEVDSSTRQLDEYSSWVEKLHPKADAAQVLISGLQKVITRHAPRGKDCTEDDPSQLLKRTNQLLNRSKQRNASQIQKPNSADAELLHSARQTLHRLNEAERKLAADQEQIAALQRDLYEAAEACRLAESRAASAALRLEYKQSVEDDLRVAATRAKAIADRRQAKVERMHLELLELRRLYKLTSLELQDIRKAADLQAHEISTLESGL
eukprot:scaffold357432_cov26-Prasinocladus_malaysianus.AAC.1